MAGNFPCTTPFIGSFGYFQQSPSKTSTRARGPMTLASWVFEDFKQFCAEHGIAITDVSSDGREYSDE